MELSVLSVVTFLLQQVTVSNVLLFSAVFFLAADYIKKRAPKNFPPGPFSWPIIGGLPSLDFAEPHVAINKLSEKYGDIFSVDMGSLRFVVLSGLQTIKEAFVHQGDSFADRPHIPIFYNMSKEYGLINSNGHSWKQQRRFALSALRNFGMGKKSLEQRINEEIRYLTEVIEEQKGQPFDPHFHINSSVSNVICAISFGDRFDYQDPEFQSLLRLIDEVVKLEVSVSTQLYNAFPQIMKFLPGSYRKVFKNWKIIKMFVKKMIEKHREHWNPSEPRDFIDCYIAEMEKLKDDPSSSFDEENLAHCTMDLFLAGTETTSTTLRWAILYMAVYTEIQEKVQAEIDQVIGHNRQPLTENRKNMPYTNAVIHEVQRISNIIPIGVPRNTNRDTTLGGFHLPKGTTVMANMASVLYDKNEWKTPDKFNPEHFLEHGEFKKRDSFLPFLIGNRVCLGEQLAKMELFLYFTSLLQRFSFKAPKDVQLNVSKFTLGITLSPLPYKICAVPRC
ncbi:cytochrome P450 2J2-like isoform X1 [Pleurodeles waltl]|uniref:cytochrome P450 2J2-like isoform X1 n=1 Tax=Pleurodeles waltl TaxID=8319 RepID=UPI003709B9E3